MDRTFTLNTKIIFYKLEISNIFILFLLLLPDYFEKFQPFYDAILVVMSFISLLNIYLYIKKPYYLSGFIFLVFFYLTIVISTIINHGGYRFFILYSIVGIGFYAYIVRQLCKNKTSEIFLRDLIFVLEIYVVSNLITIIMVPDGLYRIYSYTNSFSNPAYILGHRNNAIEYFLPLCGLTALKNKLEGKTWSKNFIFVLVISLYTSLITWSVNEIICMLFLIISLLIYKTKRINWYKISTLFTCSAGLSVFLIFFGITPLMQTIVTNIFKKSITMSGRTIIWRLAVLSIVEKPILGHGVQNAYYNYLHLSTISSAHNYFLDYLYLGGIVSLIFVTFYIFFLNKELNNTHTSIRSFTSIFFGSYFILWIATPIHKENIFIMFAFFISAIIISKQINLKNKAGEFNDNRIYDRSL